MGTGYNRLITRIIFLLALLLPAAYAAGDEALPVTRGQLIRNTARITFEWPQTVRFTARAEGNTVTIAFERPANPDFGGLLAQLYPYVTSAQRESDGKTIVLTLDKPYRIRTFITDNAAGIDLLSIDPNKRKTLGRITQTAEAQARAMAALSPSAGEAPPIVAPEAAKTATPEPDKTKPAEAQAVPVNDSAAVPPSQAAKQETKASTTVKIGVSAAEDNAVLRLPLTERVAMAVFMRAGSLWVVCNKPLNLDLSDFDSLPKTVIGKAELLPAKQGTILRVPVTGAVHAGVAKEENAAEWAILLTPKDRPLKTALKVDVNTDPPAPAHVFIPVLEMTDPVTIQDPQVGDTLVVTPVFNLGEGIPAKREFVDFTLLETAQGIAVVKKTDDVAVVQVRDGLRVALPQGSALTPGLPETQGKSADQLQGGATLFPYETWKLEEPVTVEHRREVIRTLFHRIVESKNAQEGNQARLRLAQLYLSEGLSPEAIALLDGINRTNPVFYRSAKLAALRGAANFLMDRYADAARDFSASELNNNKEAEYWRNMLSDLLGNLTSYDFLALNDDYISKYPPLFRQRLAIVAADREIDSKEYNVALKIFDTLHQANLLDPISGYANFLLAKISADTGQEEDASDMWDKLAEDYRHPFVRSRAEFSRVAWGMDHGTLTKDQVIDRLERLRLSWHGDGLELKVLTLLGDLYAEKKDYVNAMRIWDGGVTCFPNTSASIAMSHKMEQAFIVMFNEGGADSLPTLDALSVYYQYRNYTPAGTTGNEMIERLADRLIAVDLLEQAAGLLDHQMHFQTEKEQRSRIGARLATVHLLNRQPQKALQVLEDSMYGENPVLLRLQRNRLTAEAMAELGEPEKALQLLGSDDSADAERIRLDIYWRQKDWARVTASVEAMLKSRKDAAAPVTLAESESLLKLALAYVFQNNTVQLQYLHDYFGPLMAANPNRQMFDFITAAEITPTPTNFDDIIKKLSETRSFVDNYHAHVEAANSVAGTKPSP